MKAYLVLNYAPLLENGWGVEVKLHAFITSAQDRGEWRFFRFVLGERSTDTQ
jgi:hypothetical protein